MEQESCYTQRSKYCKDALAPDLRKHFAPEGSSSIGLALQRIYGACGSQTLIAEQLWQYYSSRSDEPNSTQMKLGTEQTSVSNEGDTVFHLLIAFR